jgi:hypothetical protein
MIYKILIGLFNLHHIHRYWRHDVTTDYIQQEQANYALLLVVYINRCAFLIYDLSADL